MRNNMSFVSAWRVSSMRDRCVGAAIMVGAAGVVCIIALEAVVRFLAMWRIAFG